jgi:hypothetical protein
MIHLLISLKNMSKNIRMIDDRIGVRCGMMIHTKDFVLKPKKHNTVIITFPTDSSPHAANNFILIGIIIAFQFKRCCTDSDIRLRSKWFFFKKKTHNVDYDNF